LSAEGLELERRAAEGQPGLVGALQASGQMGGIDRHPSSIRRLDAVLAGSGAPRGQPRTSGACRRSLAPVDTDGRWHKRLALLTDACQRLATDAVDLVVLEDAPASLGHRVLKGGHLLSDRLPRRRAMVVEGILRRYLDEAYLRRVLDEGLARRLREKRFAR